MISERTKGALAHMKSQGRRVGESPVGFQLADDGLHLVEDPVEQETLRVIRVLRSRRKKWAEIAEEMNCRGSHTKKGRPWSWRTALAAA